MNIRVWSFLLSYLNQKFLVTFISHCSDQATKSPMLFMELIFKITAEFGKASWPTRSNACCMIANRWSDIVWKNFFFKFQFPDCSQKDKKKCVNVCTWIRKNVPTFLLLDSEICVAFYLSIVIHRLTNQILQDQYIGEEYKIYIYIGLIQDHIQWVRSETCQAHGRLGYFIIRTDPHYFVSLKFSFSVARQCGKGKLLFISVTVHSIQHSLIIIIATQL